MQSIEALNAVDLRHVNRAWAFADSNRGAIDQAWQKRLQVNPHLWNGQVLIAHDVIVAGGALSARLSTTDYASFLVWRDWGWPDQSVFNVFGMGVIRTVDGVLVYGEMAHQTANAGMIYPPGGSLEPRDVKPDGRIDLDGSIRDEICEEIGLDLAQVSSGSMFAVVEGQRLAVVKAINLDQSFGELEALFAAHVAGHDQPELTRLVAVRSISDITAAMPDWAQNVARALL